ARGSAKPSGAAGLAGYRIYPHGLGCASDAAADRHVGGVPAELASTGGSARKGPGESAAGAWAALPAAGGDGSRQRLVDQRIAHRPDRRTQCIPVPAPRTVGGDGLRRRLFGPDLLAQLGQGPVSAEHVYILETDFTAALVE